MDRVAAERGPVPVDSRSPGSAERDRTTSGPALSVPVSRLIRRAETATITERPTRIRRSVAKSTTANVGPVAAIADSALSGAVATRAAASKALIKAGTTKANHPWVKKRTAENNGKVPNSVKEYKWGAPHRNRSADLPGRKGRGGYREYYINKVSDAGVADGAPTRVERLVVSNSTKDVFHTDTHYGRDGSPAFTHYGTI